MPRLLAALAIIALFAATAGVAQAQTPTIPTVSTIAVTSNPGTDNTYTTLDVITVTVTFSEAVTVTGTPRITLDIGGTEQTVDYSGAGPGTGQLLFSYTVQPLDQDDDGVEVKANSLALRGGTIRSTDDSTNATLTHAAQSAANHRVDTELVLISNMEQADGTALRINAGETIRLSFDTWSSSVIYELNQIVLDVKTASDTLTLAVSTRIDPVNREPLISQFTGSVAAAGRQTFRSDTYTHVIDGGEYLSRPTVHLHLTASGSGHVELGTTASTAEDAAGAYRWSIGDSVFRSTDGATYVEETSAHLPRFSVVGHTTETLRILAADIVSEPYSGTTYAAGENIEVRILLNGSVRVLTSPLTVPLHFGDGVQNRREARLVNIAGNFRDDASTLNFFRPELRRYALYFAYTVQPGDVDADGVVLGADPLGTSDSRIEHALDNRVKMDLSFPAQSPSAGQRVDGSRAFTCDAVHCAYVTTAGNASGEEREVELIGYFGHSFSESENGSLSGRLFGYDGHEYFCSRNSVFFRLATGGDASQTYVEVVLAQPLGELAVERLGWESGGRAFAFSDAESYIDPEPTLEEQGSEIYSAYVWPTTGVRWRDGDRILIKIVEMPVTATFDAATYAEDEGGSFEVTVTLGGAFEGKTVTLPLTVTGAGGATSADYSGVPSELVFAPGETSKTFTVELTDDDVDDDDESVTLSFGTLPSTLKDGGDHETATVAIGDDDDPYVGVEFGAATYSADEGGTVTVTVTLSADPERTVAIPLTGTGQDGATAADFSVPSSVTFNTGQTSKTFTFSATQDDVDDDDENVKLTFGTLPDRVSEGTQAETTVGIGDDDDPYVDVEFGAATYSADEGGSTTVTVTLSADPERTVIVPLAGTGQDGATAADFTVPSSVTFNTGETSKTFTFTAAQDDVDDDDESVKLTFGTLPDRVSEGTQAETTVSIGDDDDPYVDVQFGEPTYSADEGGIVTVTVTLSADPERTITITLTGTGQGGATSADHTIPSSVTFNRGETSKTFTFSATQDEVDDDDEGVKVAFEMLPDRVSEGAQAETTVSIDDDDNPHVTVQFTQDEYTVVEGSNVGVRVRLSADPERTVSIPITATNQEGATSADYTVPASVSFDAGETEKTFTFAATDDDEEDFGESVKLSFGTTLPDRITRSGTEETTINIWQFTALDCSVALLCVDVNFADRTALDWAWNELIYKASWDPASSISDDDFEFGGLEYTIHRIRIIPGIYPEMDNTWSRSFQNEAELQISIARGPERSAPSPDHYRDWTLYIDDVTLPLSQALQNWHEFRWYGAGIQNLFADWTPSTTNRIGIMRTPFADQPQAVVPGVPRLVDADSFGSSAISVHWWLPRTDGGSPITGYKVRWKEAGDSWTDAAAVSEKPADRVNALAGRATVTGLTGGTLYTVRVIATNAVGDSHPSAEMVARPQGSVPRVAESVVNGSSLTLRYDKYMNTSSVPATSSFVVMVNGGIRLVDSVTIVGREVRLTLSSAVSAADEVTWLYQEPAVTTAPALRDTHGNYAADRGRSAFQEATNETPRSSLQPLTAHLTDVPASHDGGSSITFNIEFSESVWVGHGFPRDDLLEVTGGTVTSAHWLDRNTRKWAVTIRPETQGDITVVLPKNRYCVSLRSDGTREDDLVLGRALRGGRPAAHQPA